MKKIQGLLIYNPINKFIGNKVLFAIRRMHRSKFAASKGNNDIFFLMRQWIAKKEYNPTLVDKYRMKELFPMVATPKNLFTFNSKGDVVGKVPTSGKVVLKHNSGAHFVKIVDVSEINKAMLSKQFKKWYLKGKYYGYFLKEDQYLGMDAVCFGEEYLGENVSDYKVHYFDENNYSFLVVQDRFIDRKFKEYDSNFESKPNDVDGNIYPISEEEKITLKQCLDMTKKAKEVVGNYYFRSDFFMVNNKLYLGEITLTNSAGKVYQSKNQNNEDVKKAEMWFVENYKRINRL